MKTANTEHVQRCSVDGCMNDALVTVAFGTFATSPKGHCRDHTLDDLKSDRALQKEAEDKLLRELGFYVT